LGFLEAQGGVETFAPPDDIVGPDIDESSKSPFPDQTQGKNYVPPD